MDSDNKSSLFYKSAHAKAFNKSLKNMRDWLDTCKASGVSNPLQPIRDMARFGFISFEVDLHEAQEYLAKEIDGLDREIKDALLLTIKIPAKVKLMLLNEMYPEVLQKLGEEWQTNMIVDSVREVEIFHLEDDTFLVRTKKDTCESLYRDIAEAISSFDDLEGLKGLMPLVSSTLKHNIEMLRNSLPNVDISSATQICEEHALEICKKYIASSNEKAFPDGKDGANIVDFLKKYTKGSAWLEGVEVSINRKPVDGLNSAMRTIMSSCNKSLPKL